VQPLVRAAEQAALDAPTSPGVQNDELGPVSELNRAGLAGLGAGQCVPGL